MKEKDVKTSLDRIGMNQQLNETLETFAVSDNDDNYAVNHQDINLSKNQLD